MILVSEPQSVAAARRFTGDDAALQLGSRLEASCGAAHRARRTRSLRKMTDRCENATDKPVRSRTGAQVSDVPGDKKDENLHHF
jgi:hypothetical protein